MRLCACLPKLLPCSFRLSWLNLSGSEKWACISEGDYAPAVYELKVLSFHRQHRHRLSRAAAYSRSDYSKSTCSLKRAPTSWGNSDPPSLRGFVLCAARLGSALGFTYTSN